MHLHHGVWSSAQTLGLTNNAKARRNAKVLGWIVAVVIAGGFSLVPIFVLAGVITSKGPAHDRHARHHHARPVPRRTASPNDAAGYYVDGDPIVDTKAPGGPIDERWDTRKFEARLATRPTAASSR